MNIEITDKKDNKLLKRLEVKGNLKYEEATPSNQQLAEELGKQFKKDTKLVVLRSIHTRFGYQEAKFFALVYDDEKAMNLTEMETKHLKKQKEEAKKKVEEEAKQKAEEEAKKKEEEKKVAEESKEEKSEEKPVAEEEKKEAEGSE